MTDQEFLQQFENCTLPNDKFKHRDHIRLVWIYLHLYSYDDALYKVIEGIKKFAAANNAPNLYHETLTRMWIYLVNEALQKNAAATFEDFIKNNNYLLNKVLPNEYYSFNLLENQNARQSWVEPDLIQLNHPRK